MVADEEWGDDIGVLQFAGVAVVQTSIDRTSDYVRPMICGKNVSHNAIRYIITQFSAA
jgi:hypothetical protein